MRKVTKINLRLLLILTGILSACGNENDEEGRPSSSWTSGALNGEFEAPQIKDENPKKSAQIQKQLDSCRLKSPIAWDQASDFDLVDLEISTKIETDEIANPDLPLNLSIFRIYKYSAPGVRICSTSQQAIDGSGCIGLANRYEGAISVSQEEVASSPRTLSITAVTSSFDEEIQATFVFEGSKILSLSVKVPVYTMVGGVLTNPEKQSQTLCIISAKPKS